MRATHRPSITYISTLLLISSNDKRRSAAFILHRRRCGCKLTFFTSSEQTPIGTSKPANDASSLPLYSSTDRITVYEHDNQGETFNRDVFAKSNCWGRRPFLMRRAFDADALMDENDDENKESAWPSWEDVVDIASDEESESRVISHHPGQNDSYELHWGPLSNEEANDWISIQDTTSNSNEMKRTLVVNDIDRFYPPLADWIHDNFKFIPHWRMDDGQISLAEEMGGIGPHVDNYDVFLIQMSGKRRWQVGREKISVKDEMDRSIPDIDVRILDDWGADSEYEDWILNPGDVLYLPPRIAHCGTALTNDCMTLSVGCRAPSVSDLVSRIAENYTSSIEDNAVRRYTDEDLLMSSNDGSANNGQLTNEAKQKARQLVLESLTTLLEDDCWWDELFGKYVTEQKRVRMNYPIPLDDQDDKGIFTMQYSDGVMVQDSMLPGMEQDIIQSVLDGNTLLVHAEGIAFAYSFCPAKDSRYTIYRLFANGEMWQSEAQNDDAITNCMSRLFETIANNRRIDGELLHNCIGNDEEHHLEAMNVLQDLVRKGLLYDVDTHLFE